MLGVSLREDHRRQSHAAVVGSLDMGNYEGREDLQEHYQVIVTIKGKGDEA